MSESFANHCPYHNVVKGSDSGKKLHFVDCWLVAGFSVNLEVLNKTRPEREPGNASYCPDLPQGLLHNIKGRIC